MEKIWKKNYFLSVVVVSLLYFLNSMGTCGVELSPRQSSCTKKCTTKYSSTMTQVNCSYCECQRIPYKVIPFNVTEIDMTGNHLKVLTKIVSHYSAAFHQWIYRKIVYVKLRKELSTVYRDWKHWNYHRILSNRLLMIFSPNWNL